MYKLVLILVLLSPAFMFAQPKSYTIVFLNKKPDAEQIDKATETKLYEGHMANIRRLASEGRLLAAGPFEGGGGIFILNTTSMEEAETWISSDPAIRAKRWNIEKLPYTPRIGSVCPVAEVTELVSYTFVRFNAIVEKFTASTYPNLLLQHDAYVRKVTSSMDIITEAIFGPSDGGILIVKDELKPDVFSEDPGVQQGLIHVVGKKLYVPKNSFCEEGRQPSVVFNSGLCSVEYEDPSKNCFRTSQYLPLCFRTAILSAINSALYSFLENSSQASRYCCFLRSRNASVRCGW